MRMFVLGTGQAGGKIADTLWASDRRLYSVLAINSAEFDLAGLRHLRPESKLLIGDYRVGRRGVGANAELGAEIANDYIGVIMDKIKAMERDCDGFLLATGLAGGTGGGVALVVAAKLKEYLRKPVYCLGVLPSMTAMPPEKEALCLSNAVRSFSRLVKVVDNMILFDNQNFERQDKTRESMAEEYRRYNQAVVDRLNLLFRADEFSHLNMVPQEVAGTSEIMETLKGGGVSSIGYQEVKLKGLKNEKIAPDAKYLELLIQASTRRENLTYPCDIFNAGRVLMISSGRPEHLYSAGLRSARGWLEGQMGIGKALYGDLPDKRADKMAVVTLISRIEDMSRIRQMERRIEELLAT